MPFAPAVPHLRDCGEVRYEGRGCIEFFAQQKFGGGVCSCYIEDMTRRGKILVCVSSSFLLAASIRAAAPAPQANPYQAIVTRNVFAVHLIVVPPPVPPPQPRAKITLTGITTIFGDKRAILKVQFPAAGLNVPAHEKSYILSEGQSQDGITVLSVDEIAGIVKVNNDGSPEMLDIAKNGEKAIAVPGAAPPISLPMPVKPVPAVSGIAPPSPVGNSRLPTRTLRPPSNSGGLGVTTGGFTASSTANQNSSEMSAEEQMIMMELERERTKNLVQAGKLPPLPPTPITPEGSPSGGIRFPGTGKVPLPPPPP